MGELGSLWISSRNNDIAFFITAGFIGIIYGLIADGSSFATIGNFLIYLILGLTHFGSTWSFYFDGNNREYFKQSPFYFFYIPIILALMPIGLALGGLFTLTIVITYWFSGFHVMKQSTGIASIYRHRIGINDLKDRKIDNFVILGASTLFLVARYLIFTDFGFEDIFKNNFGLIVALILISIFVAGFLKWIHTSWLRYKVYGKKMMPLFFFSLVSIMLFTPFIFVEAFEVAFMSNLLGHYTQYIALVWLITRNKYREKGDEKSSLLTHLSKSFFLYFSVLLLYAVAVTLIGNLSPLIPVIGLTWAHFFVDRFLFRFRDPKMREAILPYIKPV